MEVLEWVAAGLGVINVGLLVRRSIWNYPFGLAMVAVTFFVLFEKDLPSEALLQIFFFVVQIYGWRNWLQSKQESGEVEVELLTTRQRIVWAFGTVVASMAWGLCVYLVFANASAPFVDAFIAGASVSAQILLAKRKLENWPIWILVDAVSIGLLWSRNLPYLAGLSGLLLILSIAGFIDWHRKLRAQGRPA
jgi:nicotinamide mononucleotide transporter